LGVEADAVGVGGGNDIGVESIRPPANLFLLLFRLLIRHYLVVT
jgi:hypothetical protein